MPDKPATHPPRVVIVGGGFGGLNAALALRRSRVDITLIDRTNHHVFQPLLYEVATAGLSPADIAVPIRTILRRQRNCRVMMAEVLGVDLAARTVRMHSAEVPFDYLVLATGATHSYFGHTDWSAHALGLKTLDDATAMRAHLLASFERAEMESDPGERASLQSIVIVGGGPTGVELAGAVAELTRLTMVHDFRSIRPQDTRIILVEAGERLLVGFHPDLSASAKRALERMGVDVRLNARVEDIDDRSVLLSTGPVPCRTVLWAAGVKATAAAEWLGVPTDRQGRIPVSPRLEVPNAGGIFAIGDLAHLEQDGRPLPGIAPVARQQGAYVAKVIRARTEGRLEPEPFHYKSPPNLATVGRAFAVAEVGRMRIKGFIAWIVWLFVHILFLIDFKNRVVVMTQWAWRYFTFGKSARLILLHDISFSEAKAGSGNKKEGPAH